MTLKYPWLLLLFLVWIPLIWWYVRRYRNASPSLGLSSLTAVSSLPTSWKVWVHHFCFVLELFAIGAVIVALCLPQSHDSFRTSSVEGTDIVIALDISGSMSADDFKPSRFAAAKDVAQKFVNKRENDNMGLVVFSGESLSLMPLTNDRAALLAAIQNVKMGDLQDGTAIGDGLASAVNRVAQGKAKSKSIVLLTDGTNNAGDVPPSTAAAIAKQKGIRVYTIGVGTNGTIAIQDPYGFSTTTMETKIDEESLKAIAQTTDGKFFRATDEGMLRKVFEEIDELEKSRLDVTRFTRTEENFTPWIVGAMCAFSLMLLLRYTVVRRIP